MVGALTNVSGDRRRASAGRKIALHRYRSGRHTIDRVYQNQGETLLLNSLLGSGAAGMVGVTVRHADFHIGLEFVGSVGFRWRCTDVDTANAGYPATVQH